MRRSWIPLASAALLAPLLVAPVPALAAGSTFTWTGEGTSSSWSNADNWSPHEVPGDGDSVVIAPTANIDHVSDVPTVSLHDLTMTGDPSTVSLGDDGSGTVTVTHGLGWDGGTFDVPVVLAAGATGLAGPGFGKDLAGGTLTVAGTLTLANIGDDPDGGRIQTGWDHRIVITPQGRLVADGSNLVMSSRCCAAAFPGAVDNRGTISVRSGRLDLSIIELDQRGTIEVARGAAMTLDRGVARLQDGRYTGGGSLTMTSTESPGPDAAHPTENQGGALLLGTATLADGFRLGVGDGAELTGTGAVTGAGTLALSGGTVYANLRVAHGVAVTTTAGTTSWISDWDPRLTGYHGAVRIEGTATVVPGSVLQLDHSTQTTVARGGHLTVPAGAQLVSGSCCTDAPTLVTEAGSELTFGGGAGAPALFRWITTTNRGTITVAGATTWQKPTVTFAKGSALQGHGKLDGDVTNSAGTLEPHGTLTVTGDYTAGGASAIHVTWAGSAKHPTVDRLVVGGEAHLAGSLTATGSTRPRIGTTVRPLSAASMTGAPSCVTARGWLPQQDAQAVTLLRTGTKTAGCAQSTAAKRVVDKALGAKKTRTVVKVPRAARRVVLEVGLSHASRSTAVTVTAVGAGRATVKVRKRGAAHRFVVVRLGHKAARKHRFTVRNKHGKVRAKVTLRGWYR